MQVLLKYPSRSRPDKFKDILWKWLYKAHDRSRIGVLISLDDDDPALPKYMDYLHPDKVAKDCAYIAIARGASKNKVHAINRDINELKSPWDVVIIVSDDFEPTLDWDKRLREDMEKHYPDLDGCLWYNDGYTQDRICTLPIMGRKYYDRFGSIYNEAYRNVYCDNEQTEVAQLLGKITYFPEPLGTHEHFANNAAVKKDELNKLNESTFGRDKLTYVQRKKAGFYLNGCAGAPARRTKYTQNDEQDRIKAYFGESTGTVLDIGANDGKTLSNSLACIERGWDAVLVDASEQAFDRLLMLHAERMVDNKVECLHMAVGSETKMIPFYESGEHLRNGDVGLLSTASKTEASKWEPSGVAFAEKQVQQVTLQELLARTIHQRFDLISIDVEGSDLEVFQQIDLTAVGCKMCIVEANDRDITPYVAHAAAHGMRMTHRNSENLFFIR